jgi:two-component system, cell cycle sensor histidine kinase and response regulator CckA
MTQTRDELVTSTALRQQTVSKHVLIVDDDALQLKLSQARLTAAGYRVTAARSAAEALRVAVAQPPDLIFSDVLMGDTDGFGFCRRVREIPALAHVPVVLASAHYWDEKAHALAERVGASALIGRTPDFDVELKTLEDAVSRRAPRPEPGSDVYEEHLRTNADQISRLLGEAKLAEGRYRALFQNANDAIALLNESGTILEANERWRFLVGAEPLSLVGRHLLDFTKHGRETFAAELDAAISRGEGRVYAVPVIGDSGGTVYVDFAVSAVEVAERRLIFAIGRDVTGRFLAAQALATAEEKYRTLVERLPDVVVTTSGDRWLFVTSNVARITGYAPAEIYGMTQADWLARLHPDDEERFKAASELYLAHGAARPLDVEYRFRHKDGHFIWLWHRAIASYDRAGVPHTDALMSDVTERKKLKESLLQAQKMEAVGQLTGGIAHDFNNILATILANAEFLLADLGANDPRTSDATEIKLAAERGASLTRQLLAFSRRQVLELRVTDLNRVIANMERMLRRLIGEDIELVVTLHPGLGRTQVDAGQIEQVLLNLVVNARDAMPHGGRLEVWTENVELDASHAATHGALAEGVYVMIAVSDTGVGMDAQTKSRLFEPFFTTKEAGRGTGLGLATCHGIVNQSGGRITVYSELGQGAVFKVYLPVVSGDDAWAVGSGNTPLPSHHEVVLLAEDDPPLRVAVQRILVDCGYRVLVARDAEHALALADAHKDEIAVLLTDVVMPGVNGPDLAEQVQRRTGELAVLFMSGYTDHALLRSGALTQQLNFIQKPFTAQGLATKLHEILSRQAQLKSTIASDASSVFGIPPK